MPGDPHGFIWRGPTWMNTNWCLSHGLRHHGYPELADEMVAKSHHMVEGAGFREYSNPYNGGGLRSAGLRLVHHRPGHVGAGTPPV